MSSIPNTAESRRARRMAATCHLSFVGPEELRGQAQVLDISTTGCRAESETAVEVGMEFQISIFLADFSWPLRIDRAVVRWVDGYTFGLEFDVILPAQRERLRQLIMKGKPLA